LWKIPLPFGQSRLRPATSRKRSPSLNYFRKSFKDTKAEWSVNLLEKEVISNQLFSLLLGKRVKRVEGAGEVAFESLACFYDLGHDFVSLFVGNTWGKRVTCEVATNANTSRNDHGLLILREGRALKL
jgi:hypothetical protein